MTATVRAADDRTGRAMYRRSMAVPPILLRNRLPVTTAVLLSAGGLAEALLNEAVRGERLALAIIGVLSGVPVLFARSRPVAAFAGELIVLAPLVAVYSDQLDDLVVAFVALMVAVWIAGTIPEWRGAVAGLIIGLAFLNTANLRLDAGAGDAIGNSVICGGVWTASFLLSRRREQARELAERAERLERERETEARAAAAEERARIAREMHDVVAHSLSVMVVQAEAAEAMLDTDPERARRPLAAVQETGRSALTELRRMLGVLREIADEGAALAPQPGLAGLDALVQHVRDAGLPVTLRVEGDPRPLPPGIDLSAYRIVQEGLTNALKHAGPARAEVVVRYGPREVELTVRDDGRGFDPRSNGGGHGLVGMRERVALDGGRLSAGPRPAPEGGFAMVAALPLDAEPGA
jgi:signal transduction histidine kinase